MLAIDSILQVNFLGEKWFNSSESMSLSVSVSNIYLNKRPLLSVIGDKTPLPPPASTPEEDDALFEDDPIVERPVRMDYGTNLRFGSNVYINSNATFIATCLISIGSRTMFGPNVSLYSGAHPLDPFLRNGTRGPELGKPITIGEDCWLGGNVVVVPGVTIGRGATVGAGSVVTKDVPPFHCVAGNPARIIRKIEVNAPDPALNLQTGGA